MMHSCYIRAEGLGSSHAYFLVNSSFSVYTYETRLVGSMDFLLVSLTPVALTILPLPLPQDSPTSICLAVDPYICSHQSLNKASLVMIMLGSGLEV